MAEGSSSEIRLPGWKSGPHHILFIVIWVCPWGSLRLSFFIHTMEIRNTRQYNEINIKMLSTGSRQSQCSTCCSVAKLCPALWDSMDHSVSGFPVLHYLLELAQIHVHWFSDAVSSSFVLFFCPQSCPASRSSPVSWLCIKWPKYWNFSFSISPSNEYSRLISFRIDLFDLLGIQRTLKSLIQHHNLKASILWCSAFFMAQLSHPCVTSEKTKTQLWL